MKQHDSSEFRGLLLMALCFWRELGMSIIPVHHPWSPVPGYLRAGWSEAGDSGKRAMVSWKQYQFRPPSEANVRRWFRGETLHNVAIVTGTVSGVAVVDLDSRKAVEWAEANLVPTPMKSLTSRKPDGSRGEHWYYKADPRRPLSNRCKLKTSDQRLDLDVRGQGGYIIAPGSLHPDGSRYRMVEPWTLSMVKQLPMLDPALLSSPSAPALVIPRLEFKGNVSGLVERARRWLEKRAPAVEGSGGDWHTYVTAACLVNDFALPEEIAWGLLLEWNQTCEPPWSEAGLRVKFDSAKRSPHRALTYGRLRDATPCPLPGSNSLAGLHQGAGQ